MQIAYKFKLYPNRGQLIRLNEWQNKIRSLVNLCLADRINTYYSSFVVGEFCDLRTKGVANPLTCSVRKSASFGTFWKENNLSKRRSKKLFNPRRSAFEIHSSFAIQWRQTKPWYADVCSDVLQQALRNLDKAFNNFFSGRAKFPKFKKTRDISIEFKPGTVKLKSNKIKFPLLGWMKFACSRDIGSNWLIRTVTISKDINDWYVSILLLDESMPSLPQKTSTELNTIIGCDVGIKKIAAMSSGKIISNPQIGKQLERRLRIRQKRLSRKKKGSNNF